MTHLDNPRTFLLFRILFNCRFYYPIYTIFFLDAGLTLAEFATLNLIWAITIVVLEVPSGALADQIGRRKLIIASAIFMVLEMACLAFLPVKAGALTFWVFAFNRVLSGAAEACASGADEALTYDSLPEEDREAAWRNVQTRLMRWQSFCFVIAMVLGAFLYDAAQVSRVLQWFGWQGSLQAGQTMKLPVVLCFISALCCLVVALRFRPPPGEIVQAKFNLAGLAASFRGIAETARWLVHTPAPLALLCIGLLGDSFIRVFYTVASEYYRVIDIPVAFNGWIGAALALAGMVYARPMKRMAGTLSAGQLYGIVFALAFVGFLGLAHPWAIWGLWVAIPFSFGMRALHFFLSQHLNAVIPSDRRATALSFRGLSMNLAYGLAMQIFGWQTLALSQQLGANPEGSASVETVFTAALQAWPWALLALVLLLGIFVRGKLPAKQ